MPLPLMRAMTRPLSHGPTPVGTPTQPQLLLTHSNLASLTARDGPIKLVKEAQKWLKSQGWILMADSYNHTKLITILGTAALTSKLPELKTIALTVAFLLKANIMDHVSNKLAEAVTTKTINKIGGLIKKSSTTAEFLAANDIKCAESTLALKASSTTLEGVATLLDALASKFANAPLVSITLTAPT
ncbi:hypothetical protein C0989_006990 [Termitomyces sp. Mn162]|nr:hypothetical protein C0989_006990 [Termitomyces sp. Mn162]